MTRFLTWLLSWFRTIPCDEPNENDPPRVRTYIYYGDYDDGAWLR